MLWASDGVIKAIRAYFSRLEAIKGPPPDPGKDRLWDAIDRLFNMRHYQFNILELTSDIDEEQVAEVFVRINSEGVPLDQGDFGLTLLSVWWEEGRKALEDFARSAKLDPPGPKSSANTYIDPSPDELLRVATALAFMRGRLRPVYQALRGRDITTGDISPEAREAQFAKLRDAQAADLEQPVVAGPKRPASVKWKLNDMIESEESGVLEYKSSAFYSYEPDVPEKVVAESVIKTVAAFLNTDGGVLVIGVSDHHQVLGIRPDPERKGVDTDRYVNALSSVLLSALGGAVASKVRIDIEELEGEPICIITVQPSPEPVYAKMSSGGQAFFSPIQQHNRPLEGKDLVSHVKAKCA